MTIPALFILFGAIACAQTAAISGSVVDDAGTPVADAKVYYNNTPATVRDRAGHMHAMGPMIRSNVTTAKDGTFSVTALSPSVYWLCAEDAQGTQIRSCDWGFGGMKVDLSKTSSVTNVKLQVHSGVTLTFQVSDPRNQIKDFPSGMPAPGATGNFRIFVVDGSLVKAAQLVSVASGVHQYTITVPSTRSLRLLLDTKLAVASQKSAQLTAGATNETIAINGQPVTYNLTVP